MSHVEHVQSDIEEARRLIAEAAEGAEAGLRLEWPLRAVSDRLLAAHQDPRTPYFLGRYALQLSMACRNYADAGLDWRHGNFDAAIGEAEIANVWIAKANEFLARMGGVVRV